METVDFSDKLVPKFSTKSMFERNILVEKLQNKKIVCEQGENVMQPCVSVM